jgi:hypothetical protein
MITTMLAWTLVQGPRKRPPPTDKWAAPVARVFASDGGEYTFKVVPPADGGANGTLFSVGPDATETQVWTRSLENIPVEVYVSGEGHVATIDNWGGKGKRHSLVMYDRTGKTIADLSLAELFPDLRPKSNPMVLVTPSSNHWDVNAHIGYVDPLSIRNWSTHEAAYAERTATGLLFKIQTSWRETLLIDPDTGKILDRELGK